MDNMWKIAVVALAVVSAACGNKPNFTRLAANADSLNGPPGGGASPILLFADSFERDTDTINSITNWRTWVGGSYNKIAYHDAGVVILNDQAMGPAPDGTRALYFFDQHTGRNIHFMTPSFDVSQLASIQISCKVLMGDDPEGTLHSDWYSSPTPIKRRHLALEVCNGTPVECGLSEVLSAAGINGPKWVTLRESNWDYWDGLSADSPLASWDLAAVNLDASALDKSQPVTFRFKSRKVVTYATSSLSSESYRVATGDSGSHECEHTPDERVSGTHAAIDDCKVIGMPVGGQTPPGGGGGGGAPGEFPPIGI